MTYLFTLGYSYSHIATARSTLSALIHITGVNSLSEHPLTKRLIKGIFNSRPPQPHYKFTWDTGFLINYLKLLDTNQLDFKFLTYKTATLLTVLSGQRVSTVHNFILSHLHLDENTAIFNIPTLLKHSRPERKNEPIIYNSYPHDDSLCPVKLIATYIKARNKLVVDNTYDKFFITHRKPHHPASKDTISRWIKATMKGAGIYVSVFKPHSCRSASSSQANRSAVPIEHILKSGQWKSSDTFYKFYNRNIVWFDVKEGADFANNILSM